MLLFDYKVKMARKPGKKQKENPVDCTGESKRWKGNIKEGKTRSVLELILEMRFGDEVKTPASTDVDNSVFDASL